MTQGQLLSQVIQEKAQNISSLEKSGQCYMDSIKSDYVEILFPELVSFVDHGNLRQSITEEDIRTGLELFYAILFCPVMNIKLFRFVDQLLSFESSRTIIQTFTMYSIQELYKTRRPLHRRKNSTWCWQQL